MFIIFNDYVRVYTQFIAMVVLDFLNSPVHDAHDLILVNNKCFIRFNLNAFSMFQVMISHEFYLQPLTIRRVVSKMTFNQGV